MANSYKDTMNLPHTDFAMRANLPENEPKRLAKWEAERIYERVLEKNRDGKPFILHDGHACHNFEKSPGPCGKRKGIRYTIPV